MAKRLLAFLCAFILILSLFACAKGSNETETEPPQVVEYENTNEAPIDGGTLRLCLYGTDSLNPLATQNAENMRTLKLLYDGLFTINQDLSYTPNLCEVYSVSEDGCHYTFQIKDNIYFHDGKKLSAYDVEFSLRTLLIAGGFYAKLLCDVDSVSSGDKLLHISLKRPVANFPALLDFPVISSRTEATPQDAVDKMSEYLPNGTGPYKLQSYQKNKELFFIRNENYHKNQTSHINSILVSMVSDRDTAIHMLENHNIDALSSKVLSPSEYTPKRVLSSVDFPTNNLVFLGFNHNTPALSGADTRRAISMAIDRGKLTQGLNIGSVAPCDIPLHPQSWLFREGEEAYLFDAEQAKIILAQDGWSDTDNDGKLDRTRNESYEVLELSILVNQENSQRIKLAGQVKTALEQIGMRIEIIQVPFESYVLRINQGQYQLAICEIEMSDNCDMKFLLESEYNSFGVVNNPLDDVMRQADKIDSVQQIKELYGEMCTLLRQDMPIAALYFKDASFIFDEALRGNIKPTSSNPYNNIHEWFLKYE